MGRFSPAVTACYLSVSWLQAVPLTTHQRVPSHFHIGSCFVLGLGRLTFAVVTACSARAGACGLHLRGWEMPELPLNPRYPTGCFHKISRTCFAVTGWYYVFMDFLRTIQSGKCLNLDPGLVKNPFFFLSSFSLFWAQRSHMHILDSYKWAVSPWRASLGASTLCVSFLCPSK